MSNPLLAPGVGLVPTAGQYLTYVANTNSTTTMNYNALYPVFTSPTYYPVYGGWEAPEVVEAGPIPESDMAWLMRRVQEVSWIPA